MKHRDSLPPPPLQPLLYERLVEDALREDLGRAGDLTTDAVVPEGSRVSATLASRKPGVLAGLDVAIFALRRLDPRAEVNLLKSDGESVAADSDLAELKVDARALLSAERTALNFLGHLSGIATETRRLVDAIRHTRARIVCTRKTTPGLRTLEKYAVRAGGGANHRYGLDDAILIKDNHIALVGTIQTAVDKARSSCGHLVKVEVEVDDLDQLREALALNVEVVLLDNMSLDQLSEAVRLTDGRALLEASGGIDQESAPAIAETGVDLLSVGWLTHSAPALDVGLDLSPL